MESESPNPRKRRRPKLPPLSPGTRVGLLVVGWILLAVGIAGLALPGIQGILTMALAAAILSLASETAHRVLRGLLGRWPRLWRRVEQFRRSVHRKLHRGAPRGEDGDEPPPEDDQSRRSTGT